MKLILEINHSPYGTETIPLIYSSKEDFLADFKEEWDQFEPEDGYCIGIFHVGNNSYSYDEFTRAMTKNGQLPTLTQLKDVNLLKFIYIEPEVYTVDEWFEK